MRWLALFLTTACAPGTIAVEGLDEQPGEGWATDPWAENGTDPAETEDLSMWDEARLEVLSPAPGEVLHWQEMQTFEAQVVSPEGDVLPFEDVEWGSSSAPTWYEVGTTFETDALPLGTHDFTATAVLPNGATLQNTVGGVVVQHAYAGTYAGLMEVDGDILGLPISCIGAAVIVLEADGTLATGDGECIVSLLGVDVPLNYVFDLDVAEDGTVSGDAGADLVGWFTYNFPADGSLDPSGAMDLTFDGDVPLMGPLNGSANTERVSLDATP